MAFTQSIFKQYPQNNPLIKPQPNKRGKMTKSFITLQLQIKFITTKLYK